MAAYYWLDVTSGSVLPPTAYEAGLDIDGSKIYVGRAFHQGDWIPAKVIPDKGVAYVGYGLKEHSKEKFQVLCQQKFDWIQSNKGVVPLGAVEGGRTVSGETLYIGRVYHKGMPTIGKIHPTHRTCYIPFDGKEILYEQYEILVLRS
ncbi:hypothetical protein NQ315_005535 [Exocentrus adspersus]|uniref:Uncharacterized protein n=1 Tax=Exocentrus adspersus TaxID=1586481 RepID=A0AAV8VUU2_9CUCU|nr:hypothetical protein NQ315_005535 [Exocentrus adspersus]